MKKTMEERRNAALKMIENTSKPMMQGCWMQNDKQTLCNNVFAVMLIKPIPDLPEAEGINIGPIIEAALMNAGQEGIRMNVHDLDAALQDYKSSHDDDSKYLKFFKVAKEKEWIYDVEQMLQLLTILGGKPKIYLPEYAKNPQYAAALVKSENGIGVICPVKVKKAKK